MFNKSPWTDTSVAGISTVMETQPESENEIKVLKLSKIHKFHYGYTSPDSYEIILKEGQDFLFKLKRTTIYKIELTARDKRRLSKFFENQYFKIDRFVNFDIAGNHKRTKINLVRINTNPRNYLRNIINIQEGLGDPETFVEDIINYSSREGSYLGSWAEKNPQLVHEVYREAIKSLVVLSKLKDNEGETNDISEDIVWVKDEVWDERKGKEIL